MVVTQDGLTQRVSPLAIIMGKCMPLTSGPLPLPSDTQY